MTEPTSFVVATAGHVDHGKSTLVRALTGMEPDRWAEERRRGLTIDLGFAWTTLASGADVAFVDVPGHERFLGNMLAGLGPAAVVLFVVAADEGWQAQSSDHRDAIAALGIPHGLIVVTKADRAPERVDAVIAQARTELRDTGLAAARAVATAATHGSGVDELRTRLDLLLGTVPEPDPTSRVRFWIDRAFSITGSGTVVTGTLTSGTLRPEDTLDLVGTDGEHRVVVRALQREGQAATTATPTSRVAVNLRGLSTADVRRGDALLTPGAWTMTDAIDVVGHGGAALDEVAAHLVAHVGTAAVPARLRPFDRDHARLRLARPLPLVHGDRLVLRDPGNRRVLTGVRVLDPEPPGFTRRGDAARRARELRSRGDQPDPAAEVHRRGAVRRGHLEALGLIGAHAHLPDDVEQIGDWLVHEQSLTRWGDVLRSAIRADAERNPLSPGLSLGAAESAAGVPDRALLATVAHHAGLVIDGPHLRLTSSPDRHLGPIEVAVSALEDRLRDSPFDAPEADELAELALGAKELAAAERVGRLLRLEAGIVLLPTAPALAMRTLSTLPQPFTTSEARQALGMTRRTVIPLLEHLDRRGWTRRTSATHREVVRPG